MLTGGNVADCVAGAELLARLPACEILHGDKGYESDAVRRQVEKDGAMPNIPPKANRKWKNCFSPFLYRNRNAIERMFCRLKDFRRVATWYDRNAANFLAAVCIAATVSYWLSVWYPNIRQARLEVEGRVFSYWQYKLQYEFAAGNTATVGALGGVRDAFIADTYFKPIIFQVGQMFEPVGLEASKSTNYIDFIEKALPTEAFGPGHHVGAAVLALGDNWSAKAGVFSTSTLDNSLTPAPGTSVPYWVPSKAGWAAIGGSQYFDISGRATYAPIKEEDRLLHMGFSGRYHQPNDSTGNNDNRVMLLGGNTQEESNVLKENLLGTPDLSCGLVGVFGNPPVAGKCVRDVLIRSPAD